MTYYARWGWEKGSVSEHKHNLENENPITPEFGLLDLEHSPILPIHPYPPIYYCFCCPRNYPVHLPVNFKKIIYVLRNVI